MASTPPVIDYEGSPYRTAFWEGQGRDYEDAAERLALQRLLPPTGKRIAEIGAGFGRLADLYQGYEQIILFDYSRTLLQEAVTRWGHDPRFVFVAGNIYQLSLAKASLDALVMVRVMHHLADVPLALTQIRRVLHRGSIAVLEYANKRNVKSMARWLFGRQDWSPTDPLPVEFVKLNYDFHPAWMWEQFAGAQLHVRRQLGVSHFRTPLLKRALPAATLATIDSWLFGPGGRYPLAPSVFVQLEAELASEEQPSQGRLADVTDLFSCPACGADRSFRLEHETQLVCQSCSKRYAKQFGIWDFKEPLD
ncbi:MAG: methyltransferase domain-containing protein [Caldilineaceae bacterium]|nr:methyltransferase domain-containing protein [Caldilineaceae bacterium]